MNFVYICRHGENEELRYSIRSVMHWFPDAQIWVVGGKPSWYTGPYIEVRNYKTKHDNVRLNLIAMCKSKEIPQDIVVMNDDFFIIQEIDDIKNYHGGLLKDKAHLYYSIAPLSGYTSRLFKTVSYLNKIGIPEPRDFAMHVPLRVNKNDLLYSIRHGHMWRSIYGNIFDIDAEYMDEDVKYYSDGPLAQKGYNYNSMKFPYLSSNDSSFIHLKKNLLDGMFPNPSKYEKD
jgi:hypothetical protein